MRLYIIRHADPDYPRKTITEAGRREAAALAERLAGEGLDRLFSSPLGRAVHTAEYTAKRVGLPIDQREWLKELGGLRMADGPHAGLMIWDAPGATLRDGRRVGDLHPEIAVADFQAEIDRVRRDSDAFLAELGFVREGHLYRATGGGPRRVAVFCHGGLGLTWLAHLLDIPVTTMWAGFWLPPSSVTTVLFDERTPGTAAPRCLGVGDTSHLHAAGLPIQPSGIKANFD
jgi:probable phosphoglycerate mutase